VIDPTIRPAVADDVGQLVVVEHDARADLQVQRGGGRWLETHPERGAAWADDLGGTFVAHIGEVVVGYIVVTADSEVATIDEVYVMPDARELGFGDALLAAALEHARSRGASLLEGEALPGDRETKNLYERAGIKARLITVSAPI
jgi:GNAT superfamily N-acetyltransferase